MKRVFGLLGAAALMLTSVDFAEAGHGHGQANACRQCNQCGPFGGLFSCFGFGGGYGNGNGGGFVGHHYPPPGPVTPTVVYPYYTTRGPRDFLAPNPRGIGP